MTNNVPDTLAAIVERLLSTVRQDPVIRIEFRRLAEAVMESLAPPNESHVSPKSHDETPVTAVDEEQPTDAILATTIPVELPELTLGQVRTHTDSPRSNPLGCAAQTREINLLLVAMSCRLKAEGARWAVARIRLINDDADFATEIDPLDREIVSRARGLTICFLWMCHPSWRCPANPQLSENVAGCFDALADAVSLLNQMGAEPDVYDGAFREVLSLLAEAQSALRAAIECVQGPKDDDQMCVFDWLRTTAKDKQIRIERYMRWDDPADPTQWSQLASRIEALAQRVQIEKAQRNRRRRLLGKVQHKVSLIALDPAAAEAHWQILAATIDDLVNEGLPPSNRELRELLCPVIDQRPEQWATSNGLRAVLREVDRRGLVGVQTETSVPDQTTPEIRAVAQRLTGQSMVLIGGDPNPASRRTIEATFGLRQLNWVGTRPHQSYKDFETYIARDDVAVVLLAIRWASHSFGQIAAFCDRHGKPMVRLPAGYNPRQIAAQIMSQCNAHLGIAATNGTVTSCSA